MDNNQTHLDQAARRQFLKRLGALVGTATATQLVSACNWSSALKYQRGDRTPAATGKLFNEQEMATLYAVCDTVLPRTDTPSGGELDCHGFIEHQLLNCHSAQQQADSQAILAKIEWVATQQQGASFVLLEPDAQHQQLVDVEQGREFSGQDQTRFTFLKGLMVFGYFTTEVGATQALNYQAVPGGFRGSIPYNEQSKAWGSLGFY